MEPTKVPASEGTPPPSASPGWKTAAAVSSPRMGRGVAFLSNKNLKQFVAAPKGEETTEPAPSSPQTAPSPSPTLSSSSAISSTPPSLSLSRTLSPHRDTLTSSGSLPPPKHVESSEGSTKSFFSSLKMGRKPLVRQDSKDNRDAPAKITPGGTPPPADPAYLRKIKEDVKKQVDDLVRERKLCGMDNCTAFFIRDSKGYITKHTYVQISKNRDLLWFGDMDIRDNEFVLTQEFMVCDLSRVENRTAELAAGPNYNIESPEFAIWIFDNVRREGYMLSTYNQSDFAVWLEGLKTLLGHPSEDAESSQMSKMLFEALLEVKLYHHNCQSLGNPYTPPPVPPPPTDYNFPDKSGMTEYTEHWRLCFTEA